MGKVEGFARDPVLRSQSLGISRFTPEVGLHKGLVCGLIRMRTLFSPLLLVIKGSEMPISEPDPVG